MKIRNATKQGWLEAEEGDGVVLNFIGRARGSVQKGRVPTIQTDGGGSTGVTVLNNEEITIRKLTPTECLALMGYNQEEIGRLKAAKDNRGRDMFPKTQLYKFAGNSVVVDCFAHIIGTIIEADDGTKNNAPRGQMSLDMWGA